MSDSYYIGSWKYMLQSRYGITLDQFEQMLRDQDNRCAICNMYIDGYNDKGRIRANVDHDHATEVVRGLLCSNCNSGLGHFKDSVRRLALAIVYLEKHGKKF